MPVLFSDKFVYLATPHTGSMSVTRTLKRIEGAEYLGEHHATAEEITPPLFQEDQWTTIRNPYDMIATWWLRTYARSKWETFNDFLREWDEPVYIREGRIFFHSGPGVQHLRFENLDEDFHGMLKLYGLDPVPLDHINKTLDRRPWPEYYDAEGYSIVNERWGREIEQYGYEICS